MNFTVSGTETVEYYMRGGCSVCVFIKVILFFPEKLNHTDRTRILTMNPGKKEHEKRGTGRSSTVAPVP